MATYTEIHIRRDSTLNWYASNPRLALGEPGVDMDLHRFKIGNGIDRWNQLPYMDDDLYKLLDKQAQETADKVKELLSQIQANKLQADRNHNAVTTELRNTSRNLNERMTSVEDEQIEYEKDLTKRWTEYEEGLTKRQDDYEQGVTQRQDKYETNLTKRQDKYEDGLTKRQDDYEGKLTQRQDKYEHNITGEFEETRAEVDAGLEEFKDTRDKLNVRMDVIAGQTTGDTEILDARVDAEYQTHPNLGANIRNIHGLLLEIQKTEADDKAELDESIADLRKVDEDEQSEIDRLSDNTKKLRSKDEHLQEQANELSGAVIEEILLRHDEISRLEGVIHSESEERTARDNELEQELHESISNTREKDKASQEYLQAQVDDLSGAVLEENLSRREDTQDVRREIATISAHHEEREDYLQEQANDNASGILQESVGRYEDNRALKQEIASRTANLEAAMHSGLTREASVRAQEDGKLQEQVDDNASANLQQSINLAHEAEKRREDISQLKSSDLTAARLRYIADNGLQEQIDELSGLMLKFLLMNYTAVNKLDARLKLIEDVLVEKGILDESDIPPATDNEIDSMFEDIFSGLLSDDELEDIGEEDEEFLEDLEGIFSGSSSGDEPEDISDEDREFLEDLDNVFNP